MGLLAVAWLGRRDGVSDEHANLYIY
jgi:hypothetical protein